MIFRFFIFINFKIEFKVILTLCYFLNFYYNFYYTLINFKNNQWQKKKEKAVQLTSSLLKTKR